MKATYRKRTIHMPEDRAREIAVAARALDMTSEQFIQGAITLALSFTDASYRQHR